MADGVVTNPGVGGAEFATDEIGGKHHQRVKIEHGADGSATDVSTTSPLPVQIRASGGTELGTSGAPVRTDPTGTTTQPVSDGGSTLSVDDGGSSITVDVASLPLPSGAATETTLASVNTKTPALGQAAMAASSPVVIASNQTAVPVSASSLPLPSGAATEASVAASAASLAALDDVVATDGSASPTKGLMLAGTDGTNAQTVKVDTAGELQVDVLTMPTVTVQDGGGSVTVDNSTLAVVGAGTEATAMRVTLANDSTGLVSVDDNGGSLTVDGTVTANAGSGTFNATLKDSTGDSVMDDANNAVRVNIIAGAGSGGTAMTDDSAFTPATTEFTPVGGTYRSVRDQVTDNDGGAFAMTQSRAALVSVETPNGDSAMDETNDALRVNIVAGASSGTQYTEDDAATGNPVGTQLIARRRDSLSSETNTDGDVTAVNSTAKGELYVKHVDAIPVTDNGGSLTIDGTVAVSGSVAVTGPLTDAQLRALAVPVSGTVTATGPLTDAQLRATPVPVSGTVTASISGAVDTELTTADLDTGAGTDTRAVIGILGSKSGGAQLIPGDATAGLKVDLGADNDVTVTGTVTANAGTGPFPVSDNAGSLTVDAPVGTPVNVQVGDGTRTATVRDTGSSDSLNVAIVDASGAQITSFGGGTQYTEDVASAADPVGNQIVARRRDALATETTTDGDTTALNSTGKGELYVKHVDAIPITDNAGSLTVDGTVGISGTVTVDGSGVTQPVSAASLPLPTGASTAANQTTIIGHVDGLEGLLTTIDADTGAVAAATKVDDAAFTVASDSVLMIGALADDTSPDSVNEGDGGALRMSLRRELLVQVRDASAGVNGLVINSAGSAGVNVETLNDFAINLGNGAGSTGTQRVTLSSDSTGNIATIGTSVTPGTAAANLGKAIDAVAGASDTGVAALAVRDDALTTLTPVDGDYVPLRVNSTGALHVTGGGGGTQYADGDAQATPTGTAILGHDGSNVRAVTTDASGDLQVDVITMPTVTVQDGGGSLTVDNAALTVVGGGVEATALRVTLASDSTGLISVDDNGASLTVDGTVAVSSVGGTVTIAGAVTNAVLSVVGGGTEATAQRVTLASDSTGVLSVDDNGSSLTVDGTVSLADGANNIGDVDVLTTVPSTNRTASGALNADGATVSISSEGAGIVHFEVPAGTYSGNIVFDATLDDSTWFSVNGALVDGSLASVVGSGSLPIRGTFIAGGFSQVRVRASGWTSGTCTARLEASEGASVVRLGAGLPAGTNSIGTLGANSGIDIGDVTINNAGGGAAVSIQDGGNSITVDNASLSTAGGGTEATALRVTLANDSTGLVSIDDNGGSITVDASNLSCNVAQINGVTPLMGNGASGTGAQRVTIASDSTGTVAVTQATASSLNAQVVGSIAHDGVDSGNPVKVGLRAIAHGTNPTAVAAADRTDWLASRAGIPWVMGGHPNIVTLEAAYTAAQTDTAVVTIGASLKIVVTEIEALCDNANTVNVGIRVGFGAANTPTTTGVVLTHPGIAPGSGVVRGSGSGILGIGADGEDLRVTCSVPTTGSVRVLVSYYTIES